MMKKYYFLHCVEDKSLGVGYTEEGYEFDFLEEGQCYEDWEPVTFIVRDGGYADYQANDLGWPLCSQKLKRIIQQYASPNDAIRWLKAYVISPQAEQRAYYIAHLPEGLDVLDSRKTVFSGGFPVKPYLSLSAIGDHRVFRYRGSLFRVIVSAEVRDAIVSANCTGVDFFEARVVRR